MTWGFIIYISKLYIVSFFLEFVKFNHITSLQIKAPTCDRCFLDPPFASLDEELGNMPFTYQYYCGANNLNNCIQGILITTELCHYDRHMVILSSTHKFTFYFKVEIQYIVLFLNFETAMFNKIIR